MVQAALEAEQRLWASRRGQNAAFARPVFLRDRRIHGTLFAVLDGELNRKKNSSKPWLKRAAYHWEEIGVHSHFLAFTCVLLHRLTEIVRTWKRKKHKTATGV